jgi:D-lactate dehydrogenase (cytochrome)
VAHAGDGNFHLFVLFDKENPDQLHRAEALNDKLVMRAISMDGTCTGPFLKHSVCAKKKKTKKKNKKKTKKQNKTARKHNSD